MNLFERITKLEQTVRQLAARTFINYNKGTFAPALVGSGTAGTFTYGAGNLVEYTIIGNRLLFNGRVDITATTVAPVGNLTITGWPYAGVANASMAIAGVGSCEWRGITFAANYQALSIQFANGSSAATLVKSGTAGVNLASLTGGELGGGAYDFRFGGEYRIA